MKPLTFNRPADNSFKGLLNFSSPKSLFGLNSSQPKAPVATTTINQSATSPARDAFVANTSRSPVAPTPPYAQPGYKSPGQIADEGSAPGQTGEPAPEAVNPFSAYSQYLSEYSQSLSANPDTEAASLKAADLAGRFDTRSLEARREYETTLDAPGMLKAGAEQAASVGRRRSDSNLADLAVQGSAADRRLIALQGGDAAKQNFLKTRADLSKPLQLGDKYFDPTTGKEITGLSNKGQEDFTLGKDQQRYRVNPKTGQYELVASGIKTSDTKPGSEEGGFKAQAATQGRQAISNMLTIAEANKGIFGRTAATPWPDALRGDAYRNYEAQIDFLKGNIIPAALTAMREASKTGGALGQVSDREGAWLAASLGAISMRQSPEAVIQQLRDIDASLSRWQTAVEQQGGSGPDSGGGDEAELRAAGYTDEQIAEIKAAQ